MRSLRSYKFDFRNEINILRHLNGTSSGHVTKLVHNFINDEEICIVMEPIGSMDLAMYLADGVQSQRPFPYHMPALGPAVYLEKLVEQMLGLASTLAEIHAQGVTHRDIRPANILLHVREIGDSKTIAMIFADFGLAFRVDGGLIPDERQMHLGDQYYAAPEILPEYDNNNGMGASGKPGDIFALGCVFYEILETWYRAQGMRQLLRTSEMPTVARDGTFGDSVRDPDSEFVRQARDVIKACWTSKMQTIALIMEVLFDMMLKTLPRSTAEEVATAIRKVTASAYFIKRVQEQEKPATPAQRALFSDPGYETKYTQAQKIAIEERIRIKRKENRRYQLSQIPWLDETHDAPAAREQPHHHSSP
jgi:serine/threonine protein kinase